MLDGVEESCLPNEEDRVNVVCAPPFDLIQGTCETACFIDQSAVRVQEQTDFAFLLDSLIYNVEDSIDVTFARGELTVGGQDSVVQIDHVIVQFGEIAGCQLRSTLDADSRRGQLAHGGWGGARRCGLA